MIIFLKIWRVTRNKNSIRIRGVREAILIIENKVFCLELKNVREEETREEKRRTSKSKNAVNLYLTACSTPNYREMKVFSVYVCVHDAIPGKDKD